MHPFALIMLLAAAAPPSSCVSCHLEMGDELAAPVESWSTGIHAERFIGCEGCHGGDPGIDVAEDPEAAMDPAVGYLGVPDRSAIAEFCGRCHSDAGYMRRYNPAARIDQVAEYRTSRHGLLNREGDTKTATCIDCHSVHGILGVKNPKSPVYALRVPETCGKCHADAGYMEGRDLPTNQVPQFRSSVHGRALLERRDTSAPACNDCHGNHGTSPPGIPDIAFVCGQCHARVGTLFRASPKKTIFDELELAECTTCHSIHDISEPGDHMIGLAPDSTCAECHDAGDAGGEAATDMHAALYELDHRIGEAEEILERGERAGMEVSQTRFDLQGARNALVNARVLVHSFDPSQVTETTSEGKAIAAAAIEEGEAVMAELQVRRKGLASSLIVIFLVIVGLIWKIRQIGLPAQTD